MRTGCKPGACAARLRLARHCRCTRTDKFASMCPLLSLGPVAATGAGRKLTPLRGAALPAVGVDVGAPRGPALLAPPLTRPRPRAGADHQPAGNDASDMAAASHNGVAHGPPVAGAFAAAGAFTGGEEQTTWCVVGVGSACTVARAACQCPAAHAPSRIVAASRTRARTRQLRAAACFRRLAGRCVFGPCTTCASCCDLTGPPCARAGELSLPVPTPRTRRVSVLARRLGQWLRARGKRPSWCCCVTRVGLSTIWTPGVLPPRRGAATMPPPPAHMRTALGIDRSWVGAQDAQDLAVRLRKLCRRFRRLHGLVGE